MALALQKYFLIASSSYPFEWAKCEEELITTAGLNVLLQLPKSKLFLVAPSSFLWSFQSSLEWQRFKEAGVGFGDVAVTKDRKNSK